QTGRLARGDETVALTVYDGERGRHPTGERPRRLGIRPVRRQSHTEQAGGERPAWSGADHAGEEQRARRPVQSPVGGSADGDDAGEGGIVGRVSKYGNSAHRGADDDDRQTAQVRMGDGGGHVVALEIAKRADPTGLAVAPCVVGEDV